MLINRGRGYKNMRYLLLKAQRMAVTNTNMSLFRRPGKPRRMPLVTNSCGEPVFVIGSTLTTASGASVITTNGTSCGNVYWVLGSSATIGSTTNFLGISSQTLASR